MSEFNLSEKIDEWKNWCFMGKKHRSIETKEVKEFIRRLKEKIDLMRDTNNGRPETIVIQKEFLHFEKYLDELAGDKLI